jgi:CRISPR/Cas system CSM-associated protein Csm3 (group 7 of RAMP superfamily)
MLNLMEGIVLEDLRKGKICCPSSSFITSIVPTNAYPTSEASAFIVIGANTDNMYNRLMKAIDRLTSKINPRLYLVLTVSEVHLHYKLCLVADQYVCSLL